MANEPLRPGGRPGIVETLVHDFHVPAMPSIGRQEAVKRIREEAGARALPEVLLALSDQPVARGSLFDAAGVRVAFPEGDVYDRCYVALLDPSPAIRPLDFPASVRDLDLAVRAAQALGVRQEDIHAFLGHEDLLTPGLAVSKYPATVEMLERVMAGLARGSAADDALLFIATNHGERQGLLTSAAVDEFADEESTPRLLTPEVLRRCLDGLLGTQVLVLATCHAGLFLPLAREGRTVLASCSAEQRYLVQQEPACSPFLVELFKAWCCTELPGYETRFSSAISELEDAFIEAEQRLTSDAYSAEYKRLKPLREGVASWPFAR